MANLSRKKIIEKIYNDYNLVEVAEEIVELWKEEKDTLFNEIFWDKVRAKIKSATLKGEFVLVKEINNIDVTIWAAEQAIGFASSDLRIIPKDKKDKLIKILKEIEFSEYFRPVEKDSKQIWRYFQYDDYKRPLNEVVDLFSKIFDSLVERLKEP